MSKVVPFRCKQERSQCASCRIPIPKQSDPFCSQCRGYINLHDAWRGLYGPKGGGDAA